MHEEEKLSAPDAQVSVSGGKGVCAGFKGKDAGALADITVYGVGLAGKFHFKGGNGSVYAVRGVLDGKVPGLELTEDIGPADGGHVELGLTHLSVEFCVNGAGPGNAAL